MKTLLVLAALATSPTPLVTLGTIDGDADEHLASVNIRLDKKPNWKGPLELQDHGSFLQLVLPGTLVPEPGKFYDGNNQWLPKVAAYQLTPSDAGIRMFVAADGAKVKAASTAELLGNRIVVAIDQDKLKALLAAAPAPAAPAVEAVEKPATVIPAARAKPSEKEQAEIAAEIDAASEAAAKPVLMGPPAPGAEAVIAKTEVRHDIPAPAELVKKESKKVEKALAGSNGIDLKDKLVKVAAFSGIMLVLVMLSWAARPLIRRRRARLAGVDEAPAFSMKTLATLPLAARQKVSLIQVGDERILIGVTPEAVTFLTAVGGTGPRAARQVSATFQQALGTGTPHVDLERIPAPMLKKLAGNDPESLRDPAPAARPARPPQQQQQQQQRPQQQRPQRGTWGGTPTPEELRAAPGSGAAPQNKSRPASTTTPKPSSPAPEAHRPRVPSPHGAPVKRQAAAGSRINIGVGEDGVQQMPPRRAAPPPADGGGAIDDVTRMIREKLKNLREI